MTREVSNVGGQWPGGAHGAAIRRLLAAAPPFRPEATPEELVEQFADASHRMAAFLALYARGRRALPAVRQGLAHPNWQVRRWSAIVADNVADAVTLRALIPLLRDPKAEVRVWAVHSLACETCKDGPNPIDAVALLLERIAEDTDMRVRRQAVAMLAHHRTPDPRVHPVFTSVMRDEHDRKLRLHAEQGLKRYAAAGIGSAADPTEQPFTGRTS